MSRPPRATPRVLSIAGSDSGGGAGIQADLKSIAANGGYGLTAITALTAQNTRGVTAVHVPPAAFLTAQLAAIDADIEIDAVKIGMLAGTEVIAAVRSWLEARRGDPAAPAVVLDPVMIATSGARLLEDDAVAQLRGLLPSADLVTPNLPELAVLLGDGTAPAADWAEALAQARLLAARTGTAVLVKGGHLPGDSVPDALVDPASDTVFEVPGTRIATTATHGTGCSLSSAVATQYARHGDWQVAVLRAKHWLAGAIAAGAQLQVGTGNGPVNHFAELWAARAPHPDDVVEEWWDEIAQLRTAIDELPFLTGLADGTLPPERFTHYLRQDALYLRDYSRVLAAASRLAPTRAEQLFWARAVEGCLVSELELHESWLGGVPDDADASPATRAYIAHLHASAGDYAVLVAAVLPCYWIYQDVGERLAQAAHPQHPYRSWLAGYSDPAFADATREAIRIAGAAAAAATPATRQAMARAFRLSSEHELAFFDQRPPG